MYRPSTSLKRMRRSALSSSASRAESESLSQKIPVASYKTNQNYHTLFLKSHNVIWLFESTNRDTKGKRKLREKNRVDS